MTESAARPLHVRAPLLAVIAVGGAVGTAGRAVLAAAIPDLVGLPVGILVVNVVGSFVLGVLLEALLRAGRDAGARQVLRLALGTGLCGGFTTYSTLAVGAAELLRAGSGGAAVGYAVGSVLLGAIASWGGIVVGSRR